MGIFFYSLLTLFLTLPTPAFGESGTDSEKDSLLEAKLMAQDAAKVRRIRAFLEGRYVGRAAIEPAHNDQMQAYINELLAPLEALTNHKTLSKSLGIQEVAGPTGVAKSAVAMDFAELAIAFGFLDESRRAYQQGSSDRSPDLALIDRLGVKQSELARLSGSKSYADVKARFLRTYAFVHLDESTDFAKPEKDLDAAYARDLRIIQERFREKHKAMEPGQALPAKPVKPQQGSLAKYEADLIAWKIAEATQSKKIEETAEEAIEKLDRRYDRLRAERRALVRTLRKIWQATSGGNFSESEMREEDETLKVAAEKAALELTQFKAKHKHQVLFRKIEERRATIGRRKTELDAEVLAIEAINAELSQLSASLSHFKAAGGRSVEEWLIENDLLNEAKRTEKTSGVPGFVGRLIDDLRANPAAITESMLGHEGPPKPGSAFAGKFVSHIEAAYREKIEALEKKKAEKVASITKLRSEIEGLKQNLVAFASSEAEDSGPGSWPKLLKEWDALEEKYAEVIHEASRTAAAKFQIEKYIDSLSPIVLEANFPKYHERLKHLGHDVAAYLNTLKNSRDIGIKFTELLRMNPEHATNLVYEAVTKVGFQMDPEYFGGVRWLATMNLKDLETKVLAEISRRRAAGEKITHDQYRALYEKYLPKGWAAQFFEDYWPGFKGTAGTSPDSHDSKKVADNPLATARRMSAPEGPLFILPPSADLIINSVAGTAMAEFDAWKRSMSAEGFEVRGDLYVHENIGAMFLLEDVKPELGMNAVLAVVRKNMGALLGPLTQAAMKARAAGEKSFEVKLALINEQNNGRVQSLTLRYLAPTFSQKNPVLRALPSFGANSEISSVVHAMEPAAALRDRAKPAVTVTEHTAPVPTTLKEHAEVVATAERKAQEKEAAEKKAVVDAKQEETANRQRLLLRKLAELLGKNPTKARMAEFYEDVEVVSDRAFLRDTLLRWAGSRTNHATMRNLYQWLLADLSHGVPIESYIDVNLAKIRSRSSYALAAKFADLVVEDETLREKVRKAARPRFWVRRAARATICFLSFGQIASMRTKIR